MKPCVTILSSFREESLESTSDSAFYRKYGDILSQEGNDELFGPARSFDPTLGEWVDVPQNADTQPRISLPIE